MSSVRRRVGVVAGSVLCVGAVALVAFVLAGQNRSGTPKRHSGPDRSERAVLAALAKTAAAGRFDLDYALTEVSAVGSSKATTKARGAGTVRTKPFAMAISADVPGAGLFSIAVDGTHGSGVLGTGSGSDPAVGAGGTPLSANESLVEGALGPRAGAVAMLGLASPTGFLDLAQPAVTGAARSRTGTIDYFTVTDYKVSIDIARLALAAGITREETTVLHDALKLLRQQGYEETTVTVAVDAAGFIRRATSETHFADGDSVVLVSTLSNYGSGH